MESQRASGNASKSADQTGLEQGFEEDTTIFYQQRDEWYKLKGFL